MFSRNTIVIPEVDAPKDYPKDNSPESAIRVCLETTIKRRYELMDARQSVEELHLSLKAAEERLRAVQAGYEEATKELIQLIEGYLPI